MLAKMAVAIAIVLWVGLSHAPAQGAEARARAEFSTPPMAAPAVENARAEARRIAEQRRLVEAESGWRLLGGVTTGRINEIEGENANRRYDRLQADAGLEHPLLGARRAQQRSIRDLKREYLRASARVGQTRQTNRIRIHRAYARYWLAQMQIRLADAWLAVVTVDIPGLKQQRGKTIRDSEVDTLLAAVNAARTDRLTARQSRDTDRRLLETLTGTRIAPFTATWPDLKGLCTRVTAWRRAIWTQTPSVAAAQNELALLARTPRPGATDSIRARVRLQHSQIVEDWDEQGDETNLTVSADMPLALTSARRQQIALHNAEKRLVQRRLEALRQTLLADLGAELQRLTEARLQRERATEALQTARRRWQADQRRIQTGIDGPGRAGMESAIDWYDTARQRLAAEIRWLEARAPLEVLSTPDCHSAPPSGIPSRALQPPTIDPPEQDA